MPRTRTLEELTSDVRIKADIRNALSRWPNALLYRFVNQGGAALRDLMIEVRGQPFFRKSPAPAITLLAGTTEYTLPADFHMLISVRDEETGDMLRAFKVDDESWLRLDSLGADRATHYRLQQDPAVSATPSIEFLPETRGGKRIILDYVPTYTDLVVAPGTPNALLGFQGWEDYVVAFAAREVFKADDEREKVKEMTDEMAEIASRIRKLAPKRDQFRPERVRNVRNPFGRRWP